MFFRVFLLFALVAMAFASPKPEPQVLTYSSVLPGYTGYAAGYSAYPYAYSAPYAGAALPYAYGGYYLR